MTAAMRNKPPSTRHPPRAICHPPADQPHTRTHNNANEITAITRSPGALPDPLHGPAGCNVFGPKPNDPNNGMHQRYDLPTPDGLRQAGACNLPDRQADRLATVHWDANSNGELDANDTLRATYRYDGLNRRVRKVVVGDDGNSTTEHAYHNTAWQVLEIRRGLDGAAPAATASAYKEYAWDLRYIDAPICRWWDADADGQMEPTAGEQHYYTNDAQFSATALIDANSGSVVERYIYDPYGKPTVLNGPADADPNTSDWTPDPDNRSDYENEILYCGYRYDPETGLYQVRERYYDPVTGTWKTRDKSGYVDGSNLYEYCTSAPTERIDPAGTDDGFVDGVTTGPPPRATYGPEPIAPPGRPQGGIFSTDSAKKEYDAALKTYMQTDAYKEYAPLLRQWNAKKEAHNEAMVAWQRGTSTRPCTATILHGHTFATTLTIKTLLFGIYRGKHGNFNKFGAVSCYGDKINYLDGYETTRIKDKYPDVRKWRESKGATRYRNKLRWDGSGQEQITKLMLDRYSEGWMYGRPHRALIPDFRFKAPMLAPVGPILPEALRKWYGDDDKFEKEKDLVNAGYGIGPDGYHKLLDEAWKKAVAQAKSMSKIGDSHLFI